MQSKKNVERWEVLQGLIQADLQGGDHFSFM